ncbi:EI24 domain-containing protein [Pelagimonas sp. KU-00592-HH]|uniref:EI24 domain-containing protein n=1 Tax=Pelagimonas sp. KU-00592-HH TaxID=3127651 RepID=UPI0031023A7F
MALQVILSSFSSALGQVGDTRFRRVLFKGLGLTIALLVGATFLLQWFLGYLVGDTVTLPFFGEVGWIDDALGWSVLLVAPIASVFLMVPVASAFTSMFLDEVADAVEDRHYGHLPPAKAIAMSEAVKDTLSFLGVLIAANLVALVLYLFLSPLAPFIFWGLNGFLLGREYFQLAAMRRLGREGAKQLRRRHMATIWIAGTLMAIPLTVPLLNLIIPILGAATFTHLFHRLEQRG